jgi:hypothetical protein
MNSKQLQWIYPACAIALTIAIVIGTVVWLFPEFSWEHRAVQMLERRGCKVLVIDATDLHFQGEVIIQIDGTTLKPDEAHLCGAFSKVARLEIAGSDAPEAFLAELANSEHLLSLKVIRCRITPDLLARLKSLPNIEYLSFSGPEVTDEVCKQLCGFSNLKELQLCDSAVTAEGLAELVSLTRQRPLSRLNLQGTEITSAGVAELAKVAVYDSVAVSSTCIKAEDRAALRATYMNGARGFHESPDLLVFP